MPRQTDHYLNTSVIANEEPILQLRPRHCVLDRTGATVVAVTDNNVNRLLVISIKDTNDQKKITGKPMIILAVY